MTCLPPLPLSTYSPLCIHTHTQGMINSGQVDKAKLAEMGPEFGEMLKVFKKLGDIK